MRRVFASLVLLAACGGPTQQQLAETPSAQSQAPHAEAPPASTSDTDRSRLVQSFDDMQVTQQAYREANSEVTVPPNQPPPPKKKGPATQAPPAPKKASR
jgi:hypothetical protein